MISKAIRFLRHYDAASAEARAGSKLRRLLRPSSLVLVLAVAITLWLVLVPMLLLVLNSIRTGPPSSIAGPWTLRNYQVLFSNPLFYSALLNTVVISVISTSGGLIVAVLFAWLIERTDMPFRGLAWTAVLLPLAIRSGGGGAHFRRAAEDRAAKGDAASAHAGARRRDHLLVCLPS
jgi:ABC-type sugar transport system permease subunit